MQADNHLDESNVIDSERRKIPRKVLGGGAMAVFSDGLGAGTLVHVELLDASWTGFGLKSPISVGPGCSVSLVPDSPAMPRQTGVVVRCEAIDGGYSIGMLAKRNKAVA